MQVCLQVTRDDGCDVGATRGPRLEAGSGVSVVLWLRDVWSHRRDGGGTERWTPVSQVHLVVQSQRLVLRLS